MDCGKRLASPAAAAAGAWPLAFGMIQGALDHAGHFQSMRALLLIFHFGLVFGRISVFDAVAAGHGRGDAYRTKPTPGLPVRPAGPRYPRFASVDRPAHGRITS